MRTIKFRAWNKYDKTMKIVEEIRFLSDGTYDVWTGFGNDEGGTSPDNLTLLQFTGLKDKNGKEIYEGDLVKEKNKTYEVFWSNLGSGGWWFADPKKKRLHADRIQLDDLEVIGNIFENPELLKESK